MSARDKLNAAFVLGAVMFAAAIGLAFQSWLVFVLVVGFGIYAATKTGSIR